MTLEVQLFTLALTLTFNETFSLKTINIIFYYISFVRVNEILILHIICNKTENVVFCFYKIKNHRISEV